PPGEGPQAAAFPRGGSPATPGTGCRPRNSPGRGVWSRSARPEPEASSLQRARPVGLVRRLNLRQEFEQQPVQAIGLVERYPVGALETLIAPLTFDSLR